MVVSLRTRLALLVFVLALAGMVVVYAAVVSGLEERLTDAKLDDLRTAAVQHAGPLERAIGSNVDASRIDRLVRRAADESGARVTLLYVFDGDQGAQLSATSDSTSEAAIRDLQFPAAQAAAARGRAATSTEASDLGRVAEAAVPFFYRRPTDGRRVVDAVVVFSSPLSDAETTVSVVQKRIVVAGAFALLLALLGGSFFARRLSRRVKVLEGSANRVASGDFGARFPADRADELGELAVALDDMRRQLAELDFARKRFIATASHELRTPIFSLGGYLELLQDEDLDPDTRDRFLTMIREQVQRLGKLATDLLALSRLEAGSLELRSDRIDLGLLARAVADEFEPALGAHDSRLELRLPPGPLVAMCDPERVAQVLRILIDNAITHTPPGTDMVVSASRREGIVRVGVGDFGPGIPRSMLPHIFEPFVTTDDAQGSGLGLAIAHELSERMDGMLRVESQPGRTTFTLELPA